MIVGIFYFLSSLMKGGYLLAFNSLMKCGYLFFINSLINFSYLVIHSLTRNS